MLNFIIHWLKSEGETSQGRWVGSAVDEILENLLASALGAEAEATGREEVPENGANALSAVLANAAYWSHDVLTSSTAASRASFVFRPLPRDSVRAARCAHALSSSTRSSVSSVILAFAVTLANSSYTPIRLGSDCVSSRLTSANAGKVLPSLTNKDIFVFRVFTLRLAVVIEDSSP